MDEIGVREFNKNISGTLARVAESSTPKTITRGHARTPYVTLVPSEIFAQLLELTGEQGKRLLDNAAAAPGTQLAVMAVA